MKLQINGKKENKTNICMTSFITEKSNNGYLGITLISLVITIILMLILAGVVINLTMGGEGLFENAKKAEEKHKISDYTEKIELARGEVRNK